MGIRVPNSISHFELLILCCLYAYLLLSCCYRAGSEKKKYCTTVKRYNAPKQRHNDVRALGSWRYSISGEGGEKK